MKVKAIKTEIFRERENLPGFIFKYVKNIKENSILVVTSKIVALAEGRTAVFKNKKQKEELIKKESDFAIPAKIAWLTIKEGRLLANAGIDESNAAGMLILLPKNSRKSAEDLRKKIMQKFRLKNFGVLVCDSGLLPLRAGAVGISIGYAGFRGVTSHVGKKDLFGRELKMSKTDVADSLAAAAVLTMGEGGERQPLCMITEAPVVFTNKVQKGELNMDMKKDIYAPLLKGFKNL